ncbi:MAG TPA: SAM-dependent methyltransferase [Planctomycetes bacterium]|nr:SAM-dependent methyltransferase [Planctomycetota bacterium]
MSLRSDLPVLWSLLRGMGGSGDHAARLDGFYAGQAEAYDRFRERLLHGRDELLADLPIAAGGVLVELGAGTGRNLEPLGARLGQLAEVHLVDLCPSLLAVAQRRIAANGWTNVQTVEADATTWRPARPADVVLCAYSLTMMPDWRATVANAYAMLRPGGILAVVDFTLVDEIVASQAGVAKQPAVLRWAWRRWFGHDGVHPDMRLVPHLTANLETVHLSVHRGRIPYLPLPAAYLRFIGRTPG